MLPTAALPLYLFALVSSPSTPLWTRASPAGEGVEYLILYPPPGTTAPPLPRTHPPPPPPSPALAVVGNDNAVTDADNDDNNRGELAEAVGIEINPFPPLIIPESSLLKFPLQFPLPLLPNLPYSLYWS